MRLLMLVAVLSVLSLGFRIETKGPPLVDVGQIYQVIWSCLPQIGCYAEVLRIDALRVDGWADITDMTPMPPSGQPTQQRWRVHLSDAIAIRPNAPTGARALR